MKPSMAFAGLENLLRLDHEDGVDMRPALLVLSVACVVSLVIVLGMKTGDTGFPPRATTIRWRARP